MNRRGFLHSVLATVALTTGLARTRVDLVDDDDSEGGISNERYWRSVDAFCEVLSLQAFGRGETPRVATVRLSHGDVLLLTLPVQEFGGAVFWTNCVGGRFSNSGGPLTLDVDGNVSARAVVRRGDRLTALTAEGNGMRRWEEIRS